MQYATIYPDNALERNAGRCDAIDPQTVNSLSELFNERVKRSPDGLAYVAHQDGSWISWSWSETAAEVKLWRQALQREQLAPGERVAIRLKNCLQWVLFDQAALACGLVVVPVYAEDRADNIGYIIEQTDARLLLVDTVQDWLSIEEEAGALSCIRRVVVVNNRTSEQVHSDTRVMGLEQWLARDKVKSDAVSDEVLESGTQGNDDALATIVFTSGTTGKPKGVMLSHRNLLDNAASGLRSVAVFPEDQMLSFLPLSHMFERTVGYYFNIMAGSSVAFNRSIDQLLDDMAEVQPTVMITVPRIFERAYSRIQAQIDEGSAVKRWLFTQAVDIGWRRFEHQQGRTSWHWSLLFAPLLSALVGKKVRQRFGGRLRFVVSGGAPLAAKISRVFVGLGVEILQGYGLTEASPVLSVNTLERNLPSSIGLPLIGSQLRIADNGELQAFGSCLMQGYWRNPEASAETLTDDGWLKTGDIASISDDGYISITGRIKEIIVLATGEKVPPADMESAICDDPVFEQAMVVGEGRSYLSAIVVINQQAWDKTSKVQGLGGSGQENMSSPEVISWAIERIAELVSDFPGYANVRQVTLSTAPWTVEDGSLTPTLKVKRPVLRERFAADIQRMYEGH